MNDIQNNEIVETKPQDNRLKSFIERIERLEEEKNNILADIKEVYSEAKFRLWTTNYEKSSNNSKNGRWWKIRARGLIRYLQKCFRYI